MHRNSAPQKQILALTIASLFASGAAMAQSAPAQENSVTGTRVAYAVSQQLNLAIGADNVFDQYPASLPPALNTTGNTSFSNYAPYGRSGRFIYARASYAF